MTWITTVPFSDDNEALQRARAMQQRAVPDRVCDARPLDRTGPGGSDRRVT